MKQNTKIEKEVPTILLLVWEGKRHEFDMNNEKDAKLFTEICRVVSKFYVGKRRSDMK